MNIAYIEIPKNTVHKQNEFMHYPFLYRKSSKTPIAFLGYHAKNTGQSLSLPNTIKTPCLKPETPTEKPSFTEGKTY